MLANSRMVTRGVAVSPCLGMTHHRAVRAWFYPRGNDQTVPGVDCRNRQREVPELLDREVAPHTFVDLVWRMAIGDRGQRIGPFERRPFTIGVVRRLVPGIERVEPLLVLAERPEILPMHINAVGAPVRLRRPEADQSGQPLVEAARAQVLFET